MNYELVYKPEGRLRLVTDDRCFLEVKPAWASPITHPGKYLSLLDGKDKEILMLPGGLDDADGENRQILEQELHRRYLTAQVERVIEARVEFGVTYWTVSTNRGTRDFITQSLQENAQWHSPTHLLLIDVDGNRFEIKDTNQLDSDSQKLLASVV